MNVQPKQGTTSPQQHRPETVTEQGQYANRQVTAFTRESLEKHLPQPGSSEGPVSQSERPGVTVPNPPVDSPQLQQPANPGADIERPSTAGRLPVAEELPIGRRAELIRAVMAEKRACLVKRISAREHVPYLYSRRAITHYEMNLISVQHTHQKQNTALLDVLKERMATDQGAVKTFGHLREALRKHQVWHDVEQGLEQAFDKKRQRELSQQPANPGGDIEPQPKASQLLTAEALPVARRAELIRAVMAEKRACLVQGISARNHLNYLYPRQVITSGERMKIDSQPSTEQKNTALLDTLKERMVTDQGAVETFSALLEILRKQEVFDDLAQELAQAFRKKTQQSE